MRLSPVRRIAILLLCVSMIPMETLAQARPRATLDGIGLKSKTTLVVAALAAAGALVGLGIYFAIRHGHSMNGCVVTGAGGLELQAEDGQRSFVLLGATSGIAAGNKVKVHGSRKKKVDGVSDKPSFVVDKLDKVYGACQAAPLHP
jgi:hypothetical protein